MQLIRFGVAHAVGIVIVQGHSTTQVGEPPAGAAPAVRRRLLGLLGWCGFMVASAALIGLPWLIQTLPFTVQRLTAPVDGPAALPAPEQPAASFR